MAAAHREGPCRGSRARPTPTETTSRARCARSKLSVSEPDPPVLLGAGWCGCVAPAGGVVGVLVQRSPGLRARRAPALVPVRVDASGRRCEQRSMCSLPKSRSAACLLWARQRNVTRSTECWCALPHGSRWWNSSRARALQRLPEGATNAQRSASRSATARLIRAGMWREGRADARAASLPWGCRRLRRDARANFLRLTSSTSRSSARPKISARSPSGIWCPSNACASRSLSHNARLAVNCTL
jgi:hypothetical protein